MLGFSVIVQRKEPGILGEMANSRIGAQNTQDKLGVSYSARKYKQ
jgi:hypothetical protein